MKSLVNDDAGAWSTCLSLILWSTAWENIADCFEGVFHSAFSISISNDVSHVFLSVAFQKKRQDLCGLCCLSFSDPFCAIRVHWMRE